MTSADAAFRVGLLGHGTVGAAFAELLPQRADAVARGHRAAARDRRRADALAAATSTSCSPSSDLIVELIGGIEPARDYVLRAMRAGKHVVTANKQLLSQHGEELWALRARARACSCASRRRSPASCR